MCNLSGGIYEHGYHDGYKEGYREGYEEGYREGRQEVMIEQAVSAIFKIAQDFDLPIDKVYQSITKDLTPSEKEEAAKQMKRKPN